MNRLSQEKRAQILHLLMEGNSIRATAHIADVAFNSVAKFFIEIAEVCAKYQESAFRELSCRKLRLDEIWSFGHTKAKNVSEGMEGPSSDIWTWVAIDVDTKLIPSWRIGNRAGDVAKKFIDDLASRLINRVQVTTDGHKAYLEVIEGTFTNEIDCAVLVRLYGEIVEGQNCYPSVSSKKIETHAHAVALHCMHYNFCRINNALRQTPAVAAGVETRLWSINDIVKLIENREVEQH